MVQIAVGTTAPGSAIKAIEVFIYDENYEQYATKLLAIMLTSTPLL